MLGLRTRSFSFTDSANNCKNIIISLSSICFQYAWVLVYLVLYCAACLIMTFHRSASNLPCWVEQYCVLTQVRCSVCSPTHAAGAFFRHSRTRHWSPSPHSREQLDQEPHAFQFTSINKNTTGIMRNSKTETSMATLLVSINWKKRNRYARKFKWFKWSAALIIWTVCSNCCIDVQQNVCTDNHSMNFENQLPKKSKMVHFLWWLSVAIWLPTLSIHLHKFTCVT